MLFYLGGVRGELSNYSAEQLAALSNLGESGFHGSHLVLAPRDLLRVLGVCEGISPTARAYFGWMTQAITQFGSVMGMVENIYVDCEADSPLLRGKEWHVPLTVFARPGTLRPSELICESAYDFGVLSELAQFVLRESIRICGLSLRPIIGGGGNTHLVLQQSESANEGLVLCVVDSDRTHAGAALGSTARKCCEVELSGRVRLRVMIPRELENAIPKGMYRLVLEAEGRNLAELDEVDAIDENLWLYACLKSGDSVCRFHQLDVGDVGYAETRAALENTARKIPRFRACAEDCREVKCKIFPALGENFLRNTWSWISKHENRRRVQTPSAWPSYIFGLTKEIVDFGLACPRRNF